MRGQLFGADGLKSGAEFRANVMTASYPYNKSSIAVLADGRFVVSWTGTEADASGTAVRAQIFDPTHYLGDATDEVIIGGAFADTFDGAGG
ncbi:hypothetical protein AB4144_63075, partial [Rhizobiaceae sp. 2RAB30]